ncbi:MAG: cytochrome c3 family protein [Paludibacter sp.]|nr:cytochrome c3 family protein [Paludibacter sp.]
MNYKLISLVITFFLLQSVQVKALKSPHGEKLKKECSLCHVTENWTKIKHDSFNHNKTKFPLKGQHGAVSCKKCHPTLVFDKAPLGCVACHTDIHEGTVGNDCGRCHSQNSWIVSNIRQIHQQAGFPLIGEHAAADCNRCHTSASLLRFNNIRSDCYSCHQYQYEMTINPNHKATGLGTDCQRCHNMAGQTWRSIGHGFDHGVFPLVGAHNIQCSICHFNNDFKTKLSTVCSSCHDPGPANTSTPAHTTKFKSFACSDCHNTISWISVKFPMHEIYGKIYSGVHNGRWSACTDCHQNTTAYTSYCSKCHDFNSGNLP